MVRHLATIFKKQLASVTVIEAIGTLTPQRGQAEDPAGVSGKGLSVVSPDGWPGGKLESSNALNEVKPPVFTVSAS